MTAAEALHYGKQASGAVIIDRNYDLSQGQHRAIITSHNFVTYRGDERMGCGHMDVDCGLGREVRCGYYRRHHVTARVTEVVTS